MTPTPYDNDSGSAMDLVYAKKQDGSFIFDEARKLALIKAFSICENKYSNYLPAIHLTATDEVGNPLLTADEINRISSSLSYRRVPEGHSPKIILNAYDFVGRQVAACLQAREQAPLDL